MKKINLAVLFGGCSSEYKVSLESAHSVISHLDPNKYNPVLIGINPEGEWFRFKGDIRKIAEDTWCNPADCTRAIISPSRRTHGLLEFHGNDVRCIALDVAMPVLHGKYGEDGTIQGLLELAGIPVAGCNTLSSALCMDKDKAHKIAHLAEVRVPRSLVLKNKADVENALIHAESLRYPLFVKPVKAGSSFGITKVTDRHELPIAIKKAFEHDNEVIIEENIPGFEVGCAVLGNDDLIVGEIDEIELAEGFFDFKEKYNLITSAIHVPARISPQKAEEIKETVKTIYKALGCRGFARVDMFLTPSGEIVFNEVNTIPGFTAHSRYPNMLKAIGMTFEEVISKVIDLAMKQ